MVVAIADVACYVRPGAELDREAYRRGNSVYCRGWLYHSPMLPEILSNDLLLSAPRKNSALAWLAQCK